MFYWHMLVSIIRRGIYEYISLGIHTNLTKTGLSQTSISDSPVRLKRTIKRAHSNSGNLRPLSKRGATYFNKCLPFLRPYSPIIRNSVSGKALYLSGRRTPRQPSNFGWSLLLIIRRVALQGAPPPVRRVAHLLACSFVISPLVLRPGKAILNAPFSWRTQSFDDSFHSSLPIQRHDSYEWGGVLLADCRWNAFLQGLHTELGFIFICLYSYFFLFYVGLS